MLDKGKVVYRKKTSIIPFIFVLMMLGSVWWSELSSQSSDGNLIILALITLFFGLLFYPFWGWNTQKQVFHEQGIAYYKKKKFIRFEPYDHFAFVECYRKEVGSGNDSDTYYCLAFWRSDATYVELKIRTSMKELKVIWDDIVRYHPNLINQLECYVADPRSEKLYALLKNGSY